MRTDKYDRYVWVFLGLVLIALCAFAASCRTQEQWQAAGTSMYVEYGTMQHGELSNSKRDFQTEGDWIAVGIHPFAWAGMKMQADMNARAIMEQRYAEREPPKPPSGPSAALPVAQPVPCAEKPK